jgi:hypothetical protein
MREDCTRIVSEVFSFEFLQKMFQAKLIATDMRV